MRIDNFLSAPQAKNAKKRDFRTLTVSNKKARATLTLTPLSEVAPCPKLSIKV